MFVEQSLALPGSVKNLYYPAMPKQLELESLDFDKNVPFFKNILKEARFLNCMIGYSNVRGCVAF